MNLPKFSVMRPVLTTMLTLIVVVLGASSLTQLRIDMLPDVEMPTLTVSTEYEGASPEVMERSVTQILEEILATVPGVEEMTSSSSEGDASVRLTFVWGTDINDAATEVRSKLETELEELPEEITRPTVRKFDVNSFPVVVIGISSKLDPVELTTLIEEQIRYRFAQVPGVAQVDAWGGYNRELRVELDQARVRALGLPLNQILSAIRDANLDLPAGSIEEGRYEVTLRAPAEFKSIEDIRAVVVATREGAPVRLGQIAEVKDTYERISRHVRINNELGIRLAIRKEAGANTVEVATAILDEIEDINRDFPQIEALAVINQGNYIERSITNVANSVLYGGALAVLVLLFFLRNLPSTLVIALAIPISVVATFALVYFAGFTLNLMTLGGLALGVGMMVDSSIVVLEAIFRKHDEQHADPTSASISAAVEVGPAIVASTITTLVIFLPVIFIQGVSGILFRELAYVIAFALITSLVVSLSVVPMLAARMLTRRDASTPRPGPVAKLNAFATRAFEALDNGYRDLLVWVLRNRIITIGSTLLVLGATVLLVPKLGTEFLPPSDEGEVRVSGEMEVGTRLDLVDAQTRKLEQIVIDNTPEMTSWVTSVGASGRSPGDGATGDMRISLVPLSERTRSNTEIAADLREKLDGQIPGMTVRTRAPQGQFLLERVLGSSDNGLTVEVRGYDLQTLELLANRALEAMSEIDGLTDFDADIDQGAPQQEIAIDRAKAADIGVSVRDISQAIETAIAGSRAGEYRTADGYAYRILVQLADAQSLSIEQVLDLTVRSDTGEDVALRNLVTTDFGRGPTVIQRKDQQRLVSIEANVAGRDLGSVAQDVQAALDQIPTPAGYDFILTGSVEEQQESSRQLMLALGLALVLVYMVLACQYESLRDPLIVMCSVPLAAIGVILMLFITNTTLNIQSYIGCIMLGGIVVNNAILLVDQTGQLRRSGLVTRDAIAEAGRRRLRPILMTSLTTILGLLPLAFGIGEGADAQAPLARAVIGGLLTSMLTTLVLVPAVYSIVHPEHAREPKTDDGRISHTDPAVAH
jgi:HAE1 family hydrophobic/amphiphilic exporter-1